MSSFSLESGKGVLFLIGRFLGRGVMHIVDAEGIVGHSVVRGLFDRLEMNLAAGMAKDFFELVELMIH